MRRRAAPLRTLLLLSAAVGALLALPQSAGADPPLDTLKNRSQELERQSQAAVVELYALESRLAAARSETAQLQRQAAALRHLQASAARRYRAARTTEQVAQERLGEQLRLLYAVGDIDPIAILLGATSLSEAIEGLESLSRTARLSDEIAERARTSKAAVAAERKRLASRRAETRRLQRRAEASLSSLLAARSAKAAYLEELRTERTLTARQIARLETQAQEAQQRAQELASEAEPAEEPATPAAEPGTPAADPGTQDTAGAEETSPADDTPQENPVETVEQLPEAPPTTPVPTAGRRVVVVASAYCLRGTTATGLPVGPGIVATDPSFIPLGTRMTIPGYGEGVAADTGGAIKGNRIDVWIASCSAATAYGLQTITITLH